MSYILDALRRADAERERGAVPGLQSGAGPAADESEPARGAPGWLWPVAGVAVVLIGAAGWWLGAGSAQPVAAPPTPTPPATPSPTPAALPAPVAPPPMPRAEPAFLPPPPVRTPALPAAAPASVAPRIPPADAPASAAPAPAAARLPTRDELPDDVKRSLPALAVGGHMYSENPDKRMLIVDGRLLREGEALGNGLVLEQIRARSAVLSVQGTRFELKF